MRNFKDRISTIADRKKITFEDNQEERFAIVDFADEATELGTDINRTNMMGMQGYTNSNVTFNTDGSITTVYPNNVIETTIFNEDGSIKQKYNLDGEIKNKFTYFDEDGSIVETFTERPYVDRNTLFLLNGESLSDSSIYNVPLVNNGVAVSTAQSKFGGSSLYFNGNATMTSSSNIIPNYGDFTIEWWEYRTAINGENTVFNAVSNINNFYGLLAGYINGNNKNNIYVSVDGSSWGINSANMGQLNLNKWNHFALVRVGNVYKTFKNGILQTESTLDGVINLGDGFVIGNWDYRTERTSKFIGYIDEFRISKVARWTSNFTPPTEPYDINKRP